LLIKNHYLKGFYQLISCSKNVYYEYVMNKGGTRSRLERKDAGVAPRLENTGTTGPIPRNGHIFRDHEFIIRGTEEKQSNGANKTGSVNSITGTSHDSFNNDKDGQFVSPKYCHVQGGTRD
jgi:hypothetical protein